MVRKSLLALAAGAVLLGGCAYDGTYYDPAYAYNDGYYYYDRPTYRYYGPAYYPRYYTPAPSISLGYSYHRHR